MRPRWGAGVAALARSGFAAALEQKMIEQVQKNAALVQRHAFAVRRYAMRAQKLERALELVSARASLRARGLAQEWAQRQGPALPSA